MDVRVNQTMIAAHKYGHRWGDCSLCGRVVYCGVCGNNCCNGTFGSKDGATCEACPSAYDYQDLGERP